MGNRPGAGICGSSAAQTCVDECARMELEERSRDDPDCDPAGTVFRETLVGLPPLDRQALLFAGSSNVSAVRWVITMGANLKARDKNGTTMLHAACRSGSFCIVQELLGRHLPVDAADSAGWTPLHVAALMARRDIAVLLVQDKASIFIQNKRGKTPLDVCADPSMSEILKDYVLGGAVADAGLLTKARHEDLSPECEPFFVPRPPLFIDEGMKLELTYLGIDLFNKSAGHGLAFLVASGVVPDHPTDVSQFLVKNTADPAQIGSFLGEDFSLAHTLRLAFIHSVDLANTGIVSALLKAFKYLRAPSDLQKIDRLARGLAHLWWRTHDLEECDEDFDSLDLVTQERDGEDNFEGEEVQEIHGLELRRQLASMEGIRRLMFSTVMLFWNMHGSAEDYPSAATLPRLSLNGWLDMNSNIEADGSDIPGGVLTRIFQKVSQCKSRQLLPLHVGYRPRPRHDSATTSEISAPSAASGGSEAADTAHITEKPAAPQVASSPRPDLMRASAIERPPPSPEMQRDAVLKGWASIPSGGLERHEPTLQGALAPSPLTDGRHSCAHGILSETSGMERERQEAAGHEEPVYLTLRFSYILFLAASPTEAPYAFVRLQDAAFRDENAADNQIVLGGKLRRTFKTGRPEGDTEKSAAGGSSARAPPPFGESLRRPLPLCFLLADGRYQPFEAVWLELHFKSSEDFVNWRTELKGLCEEKSGSIGPKGPGAAMSGGGTLRPPSLPAEMQEVKCPDPGLMMRSQRDNDAEGLDRLECPRQPETDLSASFSRRQPRVPAAHVLDDDPEPWEGPRPAG
eukprot:TRINITY_DN17962_c0_g1_i1.p1 TRINITY_DN17962_c0_g1~~TRINITY_DN17962_c0_g1_i1.p1  ORF type:complete len:802 (-),score=132.15 TRINITY_DN17962_c0_g1_i1:128-2533(-)